MPAPLDSRNTDLWAAYNTLSSRMLTFRNYFYALGTQIGDENWAAAETICTNMGDYYGTYVVSALTGSGGIKGKVYACLDWISDNWPADGEEYELTMVKILDAIWEAKGGQSLTFINYIDAMRGSVSEKTVYAPYLESYLKHFL